MPESEDKKELGGLARSIDSLFSGVGIGAPAGDEREVAVPEDTTPEADRVGGPAPEQDWEALAREPAVLGEPEAARPVEPWTARAVEPEADVPAERETEPPPKWTPTFPRKLWRLPLRTR